MKIDRRLITLFLLLFTLPQGSFGQQGLDDHINEGFMPVAQWWEDLIFTEVGIGDIGVPIVLIVLIGGAFFFTVYFRFINLTRFLTAIQVVRGAFDKVDLPDRPQPNDMHQVEENVVDTIKQENHFGEVNHLQALATAVSGTVGLGNIAMVAVAISIGGPGATLWMILAGILGMSSKFVECTLGVKYRDLGDDGRVYGGPMYYLAKGLGKKGLGGLGKALAVVFAVLCIGASLGGGNAFQSNQAAAQIVKRMALDGPASGTIIGLVFASLVGIVILGGIQRIAKVTEKIVPFMAVLYIIAALFIIFSNYHLLDVACKAIIDGAFSPVATVSGGAVGVMIQGFRRAAFSNEAGAGSAAIAHSAVNTRFPASEGLVALLEPFIDTVVICTMTALVIIIFNLEDHFNYGEVVNNQVTLIETGDLVGGVNLTSLAFDSAIPDFSFVLAIAVVLFAFSTMLSWSYYGLQAWTFLFGKSWWVELIYKILFLVFTVLGAAVTLEAVIKFSDAMILALVFPNMIGLLILFPEVKEEVNRYLVAIRR